MRRSRRGRASRIVTLGLALAAGTALGGAVSVPAHAQGPLVDRGYNLDLIEIPVTGPGRVVSMGGAFVSLAEGIDGIAWNPAGYAARNPREHHFFEWELSPGISLGTSDNDVWNSGRGGAQVETTILGNLGLRFSFGPVGIGGAVQVEHYGLSVDGQRVTFTATKWQYGGGVELLDGALVIGGGARVLSVLLSSAPESDPENVEFFRLEGYGAEIGALYRPPRFPFRIGASLRTPVRAGVFLNADEVPAGSAPVPRPASADFPFELRVGAAYQFGDRPLNRRSFEQKDVEGPVMRELHARWCERDRAQVIAELEAAGERADESDLARLSCPDLGRAPQDQEYIRQERERREREREDAEDYVDELEEAFDQQLFRLADAESRQAYLLAASLTIYGRAGKDAIGPDAFFDQEFRPRREGLSFGLRVGMEMEPWPRRLKVRGGLYLEPDRSRERLPRVHATCGADLNLFRWDLFGLMDPFDLRVSFYFDAARNYVVYGFGVGAWY